MLLQVQSSHQVSVTARGAGGSSYTQSTDALFLENSSQHLTLSHKGAALQSLADKARRSAAHVLEFGSGSANN